MSNIFISKNGLDDLEVRVEEVSAMVARIDTGIRSQASRPQETRQAQNPSGWTSIESDMTIMSTLDVDNPNDLV